MTSTRLNGVNYLCRPARVIVVHHAPSHTVEHVDLHAIGVGVRDPRRRASRNVRLSNHDHGDDRP